MPSLFDPIALGAIRAPNRVLMAPLTRGRATVEAVPTAIMADYYAQRAGAGLIISEATGISRQGLGWPFAPGLWTDAQVEGWKPVTDAVHRAGGRIVEVPITFTNRQEGESKAGPRQALEAINALVRMAARARLG